MRYAYLGPEGTFTEEALRRLVPPRSGVIREPYLSVPEALGAVIGGECVAAVVPLENSVKGVVQATLDQLAGAGRLSISAEIELPVRFDLMAVPGSTLVDVREVVSHPHALAQCGGWLARWLPRARAVAAASTAAAARDVARDARPGRAAIAAAHAAHLYGLRTLESGIGERSDAVTRFVAVGGSAAGPDPTGRDRTSLVISVGDGAPSALARVLTVFSTHAVIPTWIQTWPTGNRLGSYHFFIDVEGHIEDAVVRRTIAALPALGARVRVLGSYPRHAAVPAGLGDHRGATT